jgi:pyruvate/2-oxoacid:ferredoxin oxidoreductase beta subunit
MPETVKTYTKKDFTSDQAVRWCPGCGDYAVLAQTQKVFPDLGVDKVCIYIRDWLLKSISLLYGYIWVSYYSW